MMEIVALKLKFRGIRNNMSEKKYSEADIRCAINYALGSAVTIWPFNFRYNIQNRVIEWLETFERDAKEVSEKQLSELGYDDVLAAIKNLDGVAARNKDET